MVSYVLIFVILAAELFDFETSVGFPEYEISAPLEAFALIEFYNLHQYQHH